MVGSISVFSSVGDEDSTGVGGMTTMSGAATGMQAARIKVRKIMDNALSLYIFPPS
jgi:hypothetical protein